MATLSLLPTGSDVLVENRNSTLSIEVRRGKKYLVFRLQTNYQSHIYKEIRLTALVLRTTALRWSKWALLLDEFESEGWSYNYSGAVYKICAPSGVPLMNMPLFISGLPRMMKRARAHEATRIAQANTSGSDELSGLKAHIATQREQIRLTAAIKHSPSVPAGLLLDALDDQQTKSGTQVGRTLNHQMEI